MADAPRLIDRLPQEDLDHFAEVQDLLRAADLSYTVDTTLVRGLDYYTRTLFEFQSGALEAAQNTLGGGGRYDGLAEAIGGPPTPGIGWAAGVERMLMASTQPPPVELPVELYVAYEPGHKAGGVPPGRRRAPRRPHAQDSNSPGAASRASSSRRRAPALATLPSSATKASSFATATAVRTSSSRPSPSCTTSGDSLRPPRANPYRDAWAGELDAARVGENVRVAGWVHRRRDHGGLVFIDLRDRSGIVQLVFHPETAAEAHALAADACARSTSSSAAGEVVRRDEGNVNPNLRRARSSCRSPTPSTWPSR